MRTGNGVKRPGAVVEQGGTGREWLGLGPPPATDAVGTENGVKRPGAVVEPGGTGREWLGLGPPAPPEGACVAPTSCLSGPIKEARAVAGVLDSPRAHCRAASPGGPLFGTVVKASLLLSPLVTERRVQRICRHRRGLIVGVPTGASDRARRATQRWPRGGVMLACTLVAIGLVANAASGAPQAVPP